MQVTIVICTWNRARLLRAALESMTALGVPSGVEWEVLVVDNGSTDTTGDVLRDFAARLPLRVCREPRLGLSHARNRAAREAAGAYLLFTDDDVLVGRDWLAEYVAAIQQFPEASYFGAPVEIEFGAPPPRWIRANLPTLAGVFAAIDLGRELRPLHRGEHPYGANMMIRRSVFADFSFDPDLGPTGDSQIRGDEAALFRQLDAAGHRGYWVGAARVRHYIPPARLSTQYIWDYYDGYGRTLVRDGRAGGRDASRLGWLSRLVYARCWYRVGIPFRFWLRAMRRAAIASGMRAEQAEQQRAAAAPAGGSDALLAARSRSLV